MFIFVLSESQQVGGKRRCPSIPPPRTQIKLLKYFFDLNYNETKPATPPPKKNNKKKQTEKAFQVLDISKVPLGIPQTELKCVGLPPPPPPPPQLLYHYTAQIMKCRTMVTLYKFALRGNYPLCHMCHQRYMTFDNPNWKHDSTS